MTSASHAIVVLGMHRSGTSCLAGMLAAGGLASAGDAVRNWDNARGHHEMLDAIRLNEAVLAHSGGHWLSAPGEVRWTDEHAAMRDRLLGARIDGRPALLKDPRTLLTLPFWRASRVPCRVIGIVRHPLAVARSLESWRELPLAEGVALWSAHNRALAEDHARHGYALVDFEQPKAAVVAAVIAAAFGPRSTRRRSPRRTRSSSCTTTTAIRRRCRARRGGGAVRRLAGAGSPVARPAFPRAELAAFARLLDERCHRRRARAGTRGAGVGRGCRGRDGPGRDGARASRARMPRRER